MIEITLPLISYREYDSINCSPKSGSEKTFSFLSLFYGPMDDRTAGTLKEQIQIGSDDLCEICKDNPDTLRNRLKAYYDSPTGQQSFTDLWSIPDINSIFKKELPTEETGFQDLKNNIIEFLPKNIAEDFNSKLNGITKKKLLQDSPLHPVLKDYNTPGSVYIRPDTVQINPNYPPFYNKYLDAKKKSGLPT